MIALVAAVLVVTWPRQDGQKKPSRMLSGLRSLVSSNGDAAQTAGSKPATPTSALQPLSAEPQPAASAGTKSPETATVATRPATATPPPTLADKSPASRPATPAAQVNPGLLARVVSPVTQPADAAAADPQSAARLMNRGLELKKQDKLLEARDALNRALHGGLTVPETAAVHEALADLAARTIFSRSVIKGDPLAKWHYVTSGDRLFRIARTAHVSEDLLAKINEMPNKNFLREGRSIKVLAGPFHAAICKPDHLMHVYLQNVYVKTFRVALGENGRTPTGLWKVANHLKNPPWVDPRDGKEYHPDDPTNPLGEFWIGLDGIDGEAVGRTGFGIHGTIEPETIGQDVSMGCVRLAPDDIALVYKLLEPGLSYVVIYE